MRKQSFIGLAAVTAAVVIGAIVAVSMRDGTVETVGAGERLFPALYDKVNEVDRLVVRSAEGGTITVTQADGRWVIEEKAGYPANFEKVRAALLTLSQMETVEQRTAKPELLPRLELEPVDAPESKSLRLTAQDDETVLADAIIGRWQSEGQNQGLFARRADENQSWVVKGSSTRPDKQVVQWLDRDIVNVDQRRVKTVTISHAGGDRVQIAKAEPGATDYTLASKVPAGREAKPAHELQSLASITDFLILEDVRAAKDLDFSKPTLTAETVTYDGLSLRFEGVENEGTFWVRVSAAPADRDPALAAFVEANAKRDSAEGRIADQFKTEEEVTAEIETINSRVDGWAYRLTGYKTDKIRTTTEAITQAPEKKDAGAPAAQ